MASVCERPRSYAAQLTLIRIFTLRRVVAHPWQSSLAVVSIAVGVALLFAVLVLQSSLTASFNALARTVKGDATLEILHAGGGGLPEALFDQVRAIEEVKAVAPLLEVPALAELHDREMRITVIGTDPKLAQTLEMALTFGSAEGY